MLKMLVSSIDCFECLFNVSVKNICLQKNYFHTILDGNKLKKEKTNILYLRILKKSDKMNLIRFNTVESNIVREK